MAPAFFIFQPIMFLMVKDVDRIRRNIFVLRLGAYGMSKWAGEMKLLDEHPHSCVIRTSWLFGFPGKNFVETVLTLMNERQQLQVVEDQVGVPPIAKI